MSDFTGLTIGRYQILEPLGKGGMASVYKAYDVNLEREVAIKFIRREALPAEQHENVLRRFEREAKALARLSHPNIVGIMDYGEHDGSPYLVMEYLPGGTVKQQLGSPMPWQRAVRLLLPVAQALDFAHDHHIVHRDIKPSNILLTEKGQPMLSDFGIAKILEGDNSQTLTATGIGVGTPEYMSPEQWTGQAGFQADIYSLGVVLYELVTGVKPYTADTPAAILLKQVSQPLPPPRHLVASLPDALERVLFKALAKNPADRYENMAGMATALEDLLRAPGQVTQGEAGTASPIPTMPAASQATLDPGATVEEQVRQDEPGIHPMIRPYPDVTSATLDQGLTGLEPAPKPIPVMIPPPVPMAGKQKRIDRKRAAGKPTWKRFILPGVILVLLACICLVVVGVLAYLGTQGSGPLSMLATPTSTSTPTRTATLSPTRTPTRNVELSIVGDWSLYFDWDCTGSYNGPIPITFYTDYSFLLTEDGDYKTGTWMTAGSYIDLYFDDYPTHYAGTLGVYYSSMEGTMENTDSGSSGCWYATK